MSPAAGERRERERDAAGRPVNARPRDGQPVVGTAVPRSSAPPTTGGGVIVPGGYYGGYYDPWWYGGSDEIGGAMPLGAIMSGGRVSQIGTPREVYDRPVNRFVADFVGETGFRRHSPEGRRSLG